MSRIKSNQAGGPSRIWLRTANLYDGIAGGNDYQRNEKSLREIQYCIITMSAVATGGVNAFAHRERLGWVGAGVLALLIMGFVERFYFSLRHGLMTVYKSRKQRFVAKLCYRTIQATMILNAMIFCGWVTGVELPELLNRWNHWALAVHFALALVGVSAVRDSDAVAENRLRELKAEAAEQDILAIRRAAASCNPLLLLAAKIRGWLDGINLAFKLFRDSREESNLSTIYFREFADAGSGLCSPSDIDEHSPIRVTGISGKCRRR